MRILLVEDNPGDVYLFKAALAELANEIDLEIFDNGFYAWKHLEKVAAGEVSPPDLIVLDLNLPGMSGHQILKEMAERPQLHKLPVCIFTGAGLEKSIVEEHPPLQLCFYAKVDNFAKLRDIVKNFLAFAAENKS